MGVLKHAATGRSVGLARKTLVGRSSVCRIALDSLHASADHAELTWSQLGWTVRDRGSTNGTWVDGNAVGARGALLVVGASIAFGDPEDPWLLADEAAPGPSAWCASSSERILIAGDEIVIPPKRAAVVRRVERGWELVVRGAARAIADNERLVLGKREWQLLLPPEGSGTRTTRRRGAPALAISTLELVVSADEEQVDATLTAPDRTSVELPRGHACLYVLATIARMQSKRGASGWVDARDLASSLRYTPERINVEIFRARGLLKAVHVPDAARIVERTGDGRLRIGAASVVVRRTDDGAPSTE